MGAHWRARQTLSPPELLWESWGQQSLAIPCYQQNCDRRSFCNRLFASIFDQLHNGLLLELNRTHSSEKGTPTICCPAEALKWTL